ncbi:hypothetical protein BDP27DRAFT_1222741, partial [Rhodocollybia butyracea]
PSKPYHMATSQKFPIDLQVLIQENKNDLAMKEFYPKLRRQILYQLFAQELGLDAPQAITEEMCNALIIKGNKLYRHKVVRINYTTYDLRKEQDSINPRTRPDIITLSPDGCSHPFTYGRVIGIFHVNISFTGIGSIMPIDSKCIDCLWVS